MQYKQLEKTDLRVSALCLGTVNYGTSVKEDAAFRQLDQFQAAGGNFLDTAHVYGDWEPGIRGKSEWVIGKWMKARGCRKDVVIATKGGHPRLDTMSIPRITPAEIESDLSESLDNLQTDAIDLYFLHRDDPSVPVDEIIDLLDSFVAAGSIRYYGCSNWTLERIRSAMNYAAGKKSTGFVCNQLLWSLADVCAGNMTDKTMVLMDAPTYAYHCETQLGVMAYMSIAKGYFSRRSAGEELPESVLSIYQSRENDGIYHRILDLSRQTGFSIAEISLKYLMDHEFTSIPIASFDDPKQLQEGMRSCDIDLEAAIIRELHSKKRFICEHTME